MNLTPEQETRVLDAVTNEIADRIWKEIEATVAETTCISVACLAGMLDLSTAQTHRVLDDVIDFGPRDTRITLADAKRLVDSRRVRKSE